MPLALTRRTALALAFAAGTLPGLAFAQDERGPRENAIGSADAPVTMIEYASFTCPHCATFHTQVLPEIKKNYVDTGQVRVIYREVYFDRPGLWAGMIANCAPQDRYFGVVDMLYAKQSEWSREETAEDMMAALYSIGRQAGMTDAEMQECMADRDFAEALVADFQANAEADGVDATPSFVINGEKVSNMGYEGFVEKLDAMLAE